MGLMDILNGMQNGPRGATGGSGGGMSPITMALIGLLAYKAIKSFAGSSSAPNTSSNLDIGAAVPGNTPSGGLGLDDILRGGLGQGSGDLGGVLGGLGAGGLGSGLSGGLGDLLDQFHGAGKGDAAKSWVGTEQNHPISPSDLSQVLTPSRSNS
jgi:hypothetical protein